MKYLLRQFEGNIDSRYPQGIKIYLQATKEIDSKSDKLYILVSNAKDILDDFLSLKNKYDWELLTLIAENGACVSNIFRQVDHIQISDMHHQAH